MIGPKSPRKPAKRPQGLSKPVRDTVLERDRYRCFRCGRSVLEGMYSLHHRRPRGMGGSSSPLTNLAANALTLCGTGTTGCHGWAESHRRQAIRLGLILPQGIDPSMVPVLHHQDGWLRLDNYGGTRRADPDDVHDWEQRWP